MRFRPRAEVTGDRGVEAAIPPADLLPVGRKATLAYRMEIGGKSIVYCPDHEILPETITPELSGEAKRFADFAKGATLLIHDAAYSARSYESKRGWGHSTGPNLAAVVAAAQVERVLLFHHDPDNDDDAVQGVHAEFAAAMDAIEGSSCSSEPAREGVSYSL